MSENESFSILVISADAELADRIGGAAERWQPEMVVVEGYVSAFKQLAQRAFDFIFADCRGAEVPLRELFARVNYRCPGADLVAVVDPPSLSDKVSLFDSGLAGKLAPDADRSDVRAVFERVLHGRRDVAACGWVGKSPAMRSAASLVLTAAPTDATVLLIGESGTGKELAARAVHQHSPRRPKPFIAVNCTTFAEGILESELFGHEKGAFTHAFAQKQGVFEAAHGGTIFLDEIGEMPTGLQAKLLRVLEERKVRRVGGTVTLDVDIRVIAATNRDLSAAVDDGHFRRDLYFRLSVIRLVMPRLLDRLWDVPLLAEHFAASDNAKHLSFGDDAYEQMLAYHWPGNVRELKNFVERLSVLAPTRQITRRVVREFLEDQRPAGRNLPVVTGRTVEDTRQDLILAALAELKRDLTEIKQAISGGAVQHRAIRGHTPIQDLDEERPTNLIHLEIETIRDALEKVGGNRRQAAKLLGIGERTLYRKIKQYGL